jgi:hypothetical protein
VLTHAADGSTCSLLRPKPFHIEGVALNAIDDEALKRFYDAGQTFVMLRSGYRRDAIAALNGIWLKRLLLGSNFGRQRADGPQLHGIVSGHMTKRGAGDVPFVRNARPCDFNLISGTYTLCPDGTGQSLTTWAYWEGGGNPFSDQVCSHNLIHPQHFEVLDLNNLRRTVLARLKRLSYGPVYWVGMDATGLTVAVCKRE